MNNLQYIVKDNSRYAMHVAVELCEQGDFDTVRDALTWLALERDDAARGTLTAEQVMAIAGKHQPDYCSDTHVCFDWQAIADELNVMLGGEINGDTSDGYHTFNELYHHRAVLFSVIVRDHRELAWKARKHHDGTMYDGMFIVGIETPKGQATYHYDLDQYWEMFDCEERESAPEWDGHTPDEAIARIAELGNGTCKITATATNNLMYPDYMTKWYELSCGHSLTLKGDEVPKWCAVCGKAVER